VDVDNLLFSQPSSGEEALNIAETLVRSGAVDVIVIDSVAALVPKAEIEGEIGEHQIALQARLMSQALRKLSGEISRSKTCVLFINQIRERPGVMFGPSEITPGGRALKFYASVRIDLRRIGLIKDADRDIGVRIRVHVVKNKVAVPHKKAEIELLFDSGVSYEGDLITLGGEAGIIQKSGAWINFNETRLGQGKERAREFLRQNPQVAKTIEQAIRKHFGLATRIEAEKKKVK
jgi:recombination protein RecA